MKNGIEALTIVSIFKFETNEVAKRQTPTGGVVNPIDNAVTIKTTK